jgi:hypothetical protein
VRTALLAGGVSACLVLAGAGAAAQTAASPALEAPDGRAVDWSQWLAANGPAAVLVWASWAPGSTRAPGRLEALAAASQERGLRLVVISVQEPLADAKAALGPHAVPWLHDRHGAILKLYRVIEVPALLVVDAKGAVAARLEVTPEAVRGWGRQ